MSTAVMEPVAATEVRKEIELGDAPPCGVVDIFKGRCKSKGETVVHLFCDIHKQSFTLWICKPHLEMVKKEGASHNGGFYSVCKAKLVSES